MTPHTCRTVVLTLRVHVCRQLLRIPYVSSYYMCPIHRIGVLSHTSMNFTHICLYYVRTCAGSCVRIEEPYYIRGKLCY